MEIRIVSSIDHFIGLREEYLGLVQRHEKPTLFFTHRWLLSWWKSFGNKFRIRVFCLYQNTKLTAAIPIMFGSGTFAKIKHKMASFIAPNWGSHDFPVDISAEGWADTFLSWLFEEESNHWQALRLGQIPPSSPHADTLLDALRANRIVYNIRKLNNPFLTLPGSWDEFLSNRSKNFRRTVRRKNNRIAANPAFENRRFLNPSFDILSNTVFRLCQRSWQGNQEVAIASSPDGRRFYDLLCHGENEFDIDLHAIFLKGDCVAYLLGFLQNSLYYAFDTAFDPAYRELSPGLVVHLQTLRDMIADRVQEFNFGHDHTYKQRFAPSSRQSLEITVYRKHSVAAFAGLVDRAKKLMVH